MIEAYFREIKAGLDRMIEWETEKIKEASQRMAQTIEGNGIIHVFGCGHSHMMAEEVFYRAGGLASVNPILVEPLMLHEGAVRSSVLEKKEGYGTKIVEEQHIEEKDLFIVVSTSGRNSVPIDAALSARAKGCFVIALTSFHYSTLESRHKDHKHLFQCVDLAINNHVEQGDAVMKHADLSVPFASISSIVNIAILNSVCAQAIALVAENGGTPPIFLSGNIDHSDEHNQALINRYKERIPLLKY
ncbi:SIS domain-containing protein [Caldalkalibacillus mannanilyticus]|uniref:SIS domain-containing protein n=1 Tax=Caldalkalibacillus mannanilyticus TaxID=1418 RepID=UPI00046A1341|nr:SIS domain-containing protein [Caldalkalibacillus mannanilyticus]